MALAPIIWYQKSDKYFMDNCYKQLSQGQTITDDYRLRRIDDDRYWSDSDYRDGVDDALDD